MDFSFQALVQQHTSQMDFAVRNIVDVLIHHSRLSILLIRISNVAEDSFHVSMEARITKAGPASATLTPFTIDLCGPAGCFGHIALPEITTKASGAPIVVSNQLVKITDVAALQAFIEPVICSDSATLCLKKGNTTVTALGVGPKSICYEKDIPFVGMSGPRISVHSASVTSNPPAITMTIHVENPGPMEISFGTCGFEIQNGEGEIFAELKGRLDIRRNHFEATFQGSVDKRVAIKGQPRLVGKRCAGAGWCDETVKGINVPITGMHKVLKALELEYDEPDEPPMVQEPEKPKGWKNKFWKRQ